MYGIMYGRERADSSRKSYEESVKDRKRQRSGVIGRQEMRKLTML